MYQSSGFGAMNYTSFVLKLSVGEIFVVPDVPSVILGSGYNDTLVFLTNGHKNLALGSGGNDIFIVSPADSGYQVYKYDISQNQLYGGDGDDTFIVDGFSGNTLLGGEGNDEFYLGAWWSEVLGGSGADQFNFVFGEEENPDSSILDLNFLEGDILNFSLLPEDSCIEWDGEDYISIQSGDSYMGVTIDGLEDQVAFVGGVDALIDQGLVYF